MSVVKSVSLSSRLLAPFSCKEREWSMSEYHGVVRSPAVHRKRAMWACRECDYEGDRFCHTKKHHIRIHVLHGTAMPRKRKFQKGLPAATLQQKKLQKRVQKALEARTKIAALTRVKTQQPRLQHEPCGKDSKMTQDTQEELSQPQQILTFGEFDIKWARQRSVDTQNLCYQRASGSDAPCDTIDAGENLASIFFLAGSVPHDTEDWKNDTIYGNLGMSAIDHNGVDMPLPSV